jgi:signal transduction histidine kinase
MKLEWNELNLSSIVSDVVKELDMIDKIHSIKTDITPDVTTYGDQGLIKQLLRILTDNSIKYTPDGGTITIKLLTDNKAKIIIQDEGVGIPEDVLPHIFDRFVRADESRTRNTGGAGLGLSIGKWIAEKHDGYLEVLSREGIGTRFTVVLPLTDRRPAIN